MLASFRLILTMEKGQQEALGIEFTALHSRIYCFSELVGQHWDLLEPTGGGLEEFVAPAKHRRRLLKSGRDMLKRQAREPGLDATE
jgi:hypothetical protein